MTLDDTRLRKWGLQPHVAMVEMPADRRQDEGIERTSILRIGLGMSDLMERYCGLFGAWSCAGATTAQLVLIAIGTLVLVVVGAWLISRLVAGLSG